MVSFAAEPILKLGFFPVTNTILDIILVDLFLVVLLYLLNKKISMVPGVLQNVMEIFVDGFYNLTESVAGKQASLIFPYFASFFIVILIANWSGLIPGFSVFGIKNGDEIIPFFRAASSDLNFTFALALVSIVATHALAIKVLGGRQYLSRYLSLNPVYLFVGILEVISELTKVISLSFRLFGNIFAGEVVLGTVSKIFAFGFPIPFLALEMVVGLIQALVFSMLTMAFMAILTTPHHESAKEVSS